MVHRLEGKGRMQSRFDEVKREHHANLIGGRFEAAFAGSGIRVKPLSRGDLVALDPEHRTYSLHVTDVLLTGDCPDSAIEAQLPGAFVLMREHADRTVVLHAVGGIVSAHLRAEGGEVGW